ncbi:MAG: hypothetical protein MUO22_03320, partial [Sedimentisphaerales bacterium]|nr:hypothetical protein [Sedimentisphaerales bacterium]
MAGKFLAWPAGIGFARHKARRVKFLDCRKVVDLGRICVKKTCIFCNFLSFFCKKRAFFVIFCAIFVFFAISLTILGNFGVVV